MSLITSIAETVEHSGSVSPFIPAGIAFAAFLALGVVVWSYRDVANRHSNKSSGTGHDSHTAGH